MKHIAILLALVTLFAGSSFAQKKELSLGGIVLPAKGEGSFILRGEHGDIAVKLVDDCKIGYDVRLGERIDLLNRKLRLPLAANNSIPSLGRQTIDVELPDDMYFYHPKIKVAQFDSAKTSARSYSDGVLLAGPQTQHKPTTDEPGVMAKIVGGDQGGKKSSGRSSIYEAVAEGETLKFSLALTTQVLGILEADAIKPFDHWAKIGGHLEGDVFVAKTVALKPCPDPQKHFANKDLPKMLFIGDSISIGYSKELYKLCAGKINAYRPMENCGPAAGTISRFNAWAAGHDLPGRKLDVISFNFGHWNASTSKKRYQADVEQAIAAIKQTGAELIWVSTAPVPNGFEPAGELDEAGNASGRKASVMKKHLNPWALEVVKRHPDIWVYDMWQVVKDGEDGVFKEWWAGRNVHFGGPDMNYELAKGLFDMAQKALANPKRKDAKNLPPKNNFPSAKTASSTKG